MGKVVEDADLISTGCCVLEGTDGVHLLDIGEVCLLLVGADHRHIDAGHEAVAGAAGLGLHRPLELVALGVGVLAEVLANAKGEVGGDCAAVVSDGAIDGLGVAAVFGVLDVAARAAGRTPATKRVVLVAQLDVRGIGRRSVIGVRRREEVDKAEVV